MGDLTVFLTSMPGRVLCGGLLFIGFCDVGVSQLLFGRQIDKINEKLGGATSEQEEEELKRRIKGLQLVQRVVLGTGIVLIMLGIFGISR